MLDPKAARDYLKDYFVHNTEGKFHANISVYWGSAEDFLREVADHLEKKSRA
jgi:hypothetical protein